MKISVICPDVSHNCLGRSYLLAQLLERNYNVEIVGPELGDGIWQPLEDEYEYKSTKMRGSIIDLPLHYRSLSRKISGDVIYATKPRMTSYGISLAHTAFSEKPLILDIDDWESGFLYEDSAHPMISYIKSIPQMVNLNALNYMRLLEFFSDRADAITVSNRFLQGKFGGSLIPHVRDTDVFDPSLFDQQDVRDELNLPTGKCIVLFSGTPRPHKGVADLIHSIDLLDRSDLIALIVGAHDSEYVRKLQSMAGDSVIFRGKQPFNQLPKWIAAADIFAIPQRNSLSTRGQLPAKVFDAMAMGKAIVATDVSDLPSILEECGVVVEPESPQELAIAIRELVEDPQKREALGSSARKVCVENYSYDALTPKTTSIIDKVT